MVQIRNPEEGETRRTGVEPYRARRGRARGAGSSAPGSDGNSVGATTNLLLSLFFFKEKLNFMSNYECLGKLPKTQPLSPCSLKFKKKGKKKTLSSHLPCPPHPSRGVKTKGGRRPADGGWTATAHLTIHPFAAVKKSPRRKRPKRVIRPARPIGCAHCEQQLLEYKEQ